MKPLLAAIVLVSSVTVEGPGNEDHSYRIARGDEVAPMLTIENYDECSKPKATVKCIVSYDAGQVIIKEVGQ